MVYSDKNEIFFHELKGYLKDNEERIEKDLFIAILSACRLVDGGESIGNACGLAGIGAASTHYEKKELRPYVKAVIARAEPKIKELHERQKKQEEQRLFLNKTLADLAEELKKTSKEDEFISVNRSSLVLLYNELKKLM